MAEVETGRRRIVIIVLVVAVIVMALLVWFILRWRAKSGVAYNVPSGGDKKIPVPGGEEKQTLPPPTSTSTTSTTSTSQTQQYVKARVIQKKVALRSESGEPIATLKKGDIVEIIPNPIGTKLPNGRSCSGGWYPVRSGGVVCKSIVDDKTGKVIEFLQFL